jgi:two-component system, response regulator PdtaR
VRGASSLSEFLGCYCSGATPNRTRDAALGMEKQLTILIVDDEAIIRLFAKEFLDEANFNTLLASNADEAIAALERRSDICAVITDVQMPGSMDGVRLANAVHNRWPPIAIIVTSGQWPMPLALPENSRFFHKPFRPQDIISAVHELVN